MRRTNSALLVVTMALAATGCSRSNTYAAGPAENYYHYLGNGDYESACRLLTDDFRRQLGDCPSALRRRVTGLSVSDARELPYVTVGKVVYHGKDKAVVYPQDVKAYRTVTTKVKGSPAPRSSPVRSIAAFYATDGKALQLTKTGDEWRISGWG
jgi:hypothetical protein